MINPILEREVKTRMRTWRTPILILTYLVLIGIVVFVFFYTNSINQRYGGGVFNPRVAVNAYYLISAFEFGLIGLIVPAMTATTISGERERQTLDLMLCTSISPWSIIIGKIMAALAQVFLLIVAAMPFLSIVFLFGGISIFDIVKLVGYYIITALTLASIGIFCSSHFKRNVSSIIVSYIIMLCLTIGTIVALAITVMTIEANNTSDFLNDYGYELISAFVWGNPGFGFISIWGNIGTSFGNIFNEVIRMQEQSKTFLRHFQPWMLTCIFDILVISILLWASKRRISKAK